MGVFSHFGISAEAQADALAQFGLGPEEADTSFAGFTYPSDLARILIVLLQLIVCSILTSVVMALWTGEPWLEMMSGFVERVQQFFAQLMEPNKVIYTEEQEPEKAAPSSFAGVVAEAAAAEAIARKSEGANVKLRQLGNKTIKNINLGHLSDLRVKRRREACASMCERSFGIELCVIATLALAHWMHGKALFDVLFVGLWGAAAIALVASRGWRLFLFAEARRTLYAVQEATRQAEGELPARVLDGTVRLVNVQWLLAHVRSLPAGEGIVCHQDLPPEALLSPEAAFALLDSGPGGSVAALSYGWLSEPHPDPSGFHLRAVISWIERNPSIQALFWDWLSLPQKRPHLGLGRTPEEQIRFQRSLEVMLHLYASPRVVVLQHKNMPIQTILSAINTRPYEKRGWCLVEQYTALSVNVRDKVADIGRGYFVPADGNRVEPEELAELLSKAHFTGKADRELVLALCACMRPPNTRPTRARTDSPTDARACSHHVCALRR